MKVFDIETGFNYSQIHSVVADNMGEAERVFRARYWPTEIKAIRLHAEYVLVQGIDDIPQEVKQNG
jgi:hypothetical protein